jgi:hypothetical protein
VKLSTTVKAPLTNVVDTVEKFLPTVNDAGKAVCFTSVIDTGEAYFFYSVVDIVKAQK